MSTGNRPTTTPPASSSSAAGGDGAPSASPPPPVGSSSSVIAPGTSSSSAAAAAAARSAAAASAPSSSSGGDGRKPHHYPSSSSSPPRAATPKHPPEPADAVVLEYLKKRGLNGAALELGRILANEKKARRAEQRRRQEEEEEAEKRRSSSRGGGPTTKKAKGDDGGGGGRTRHAAPPRSHEEDGATKMKLDEAKAKSQRSALALSTGGGLGYELDAAPAVAMWGGGGLVAGGGDDDDDGYDGGVTIANDGRGGGGGAEGVEPDRSPLNDEDRRGQEEARTYVRSFTAFQTWVLSLPDDPAVVVPSATFEPPAAAPPVGGGRDRTEDGRGGNGLGDGDDDRSDDDDDNGGDRRETTTHEALTALVRNAGAIGSGGGADASTSALVRASRPSVTYSSASASTGRRRLLGNSNLPPSCKAELQSVAFPLLVHTYCELLESGLSSTAASLLATYRRIHEPTYASELSDLDKCRTADDIVELNSNVLSSTEASAELRSLKSQIASALKKRTELSEQVLDTTGMGPAALTAARQTRATKVAEFTENLKKLQSKLDDANLKLRLCSDKLAPLPFLRRARALRFQVSVSDVSYGLLAGYLSRGGGPNGDGGLLLPMSALLQSRCHVNVERRDPIPYTPAAVLEDMVLGGGGTAAAEEEEKKGEGGVEGVRWAAPVHPSSRLAEAGEGFDSSGTTTTTEGASEKVQSLPFPKYYLDREYETNDDAEAARRAVEFNRALLVNGFRRLEALELKREYDAGDRRPAGTATASSSADASKAGGAGAVPASSGGAGGPADATVADEEEEGSREYADPLAPSVLLSTLCASDADGGSRGTTIGSGAAGAVGRVDEATPTEESGIGITCARLCPPDGRRVAAGCDDAAVRIWSLEDLCSPSSTGKGVVDETSSSSDVLPSPPAAPGESSAVLLGHKNGFPVFDVSWNRDGRTLISAGGDGTVRLWDTLAVGTVGRPANVVRRTAHPGGTTSAVVAPSTATTPVGGNGGGGSGGGRPNASVPGLRDEPMVEVHGAALASYAGHSPSTPLWSASFAPCGYYFVSTGSDSTARLWTTDRPNPVRILSGHLSSSVNCSAWHPNANYVLTGSDDKTARLWDVQTGRCVRLLSGGVAGVNVVAICPSGRYASGADRSGVVSVWDLGSGRRVNELRPPTPPSSSSSVANGGGGGGPSTTTTTTASTIHAMSYSACGTALATGGDDRSVRIWDVRGMACHSSDPAYASASGAGSAAAPGGWAASSPERSVVRSSSSSTATALRPGTRTPAKSFSTKRTVILDLKYTKRNLLLSVGKFASSAPLAVAPVAD